MKTAHLIAAVCQAGLIAAAFGQTNIITQSDLDSAWADWPKSATVTSNITLAAKLGGAVIPKGETLSVLSVSNETVFVLRGGATNQIPAGATDIVDQINTLRSHRIIVGKDQYDDCRFEPRDPINVKVIHRSGVATIPMAKLPPWLQKQLGYDPTKASEWVADLQKKKAEQEAAKAEAYIKEHTYAVKYLEAAFNQVPYNSDIVVSGLYSGSMSADYTLKNASNFLIYDGDNHNISAKCISDSEAFYTLINAKRMHRFTFIGQKQRINDDDVFVIGSVHEK
jgi:hypothetical protein